MPWNMYKLSLPRCFKKGIIISDDDDQEFEKG